MNTDLYEKYLIKLIKSGILYECAEPLPANVDMHTLVNLAIKHSVANIIYEPLSKIGISDRELDNKIQKIYRYGIINDSIQMNYLQRITGAFESNGISYCVMKGAVIKNLYPRSDFRQSGDLDIFVPESDRMKAHDVMVEMGFCVERFNINEADDVYFIDKKIHVELHRILVSNKTPWQKECQKITDRLILTEGYKYNYKMSDEDYYLYMIAHMAKHMKYSGMGIKMVLDVWIYMREYSDKLNWNILNKRLMACGLDLFEKNVRELCYYWFENKDGGELVKKMGHYILISGAFGTSEQLDAYMFAKDAGKTNSVHIAKLTYYLKVFFEPYYLMCKRYPVLIKLPILLPFYWMHRAAKSILFHRDKSNAIAAKYDNVNLDNAKKILDFKKEIGL